jgi:hypothetical protein
MTAAEFIASLPRDPEAALAEIEGALAYDGTGATLESGERQILVTRRAELTRDIPKRKRAR